MEINITVVSLFLFQSTVFLSQIIEFWQKMFFEEIIEAV